MIEGFFVWLLGKHLCVILGVCVALLAAALFLNFEEALDWWSNRNANK